MFADVVAGNTVAAQHLCGAFGGKDAKTQVANRLTGNTSDRLSRLATDTNTVPWAGSDP